MPELTADKIAMLKGLVAASPDDVVRALDRAVRRDGVGGPLSAIGALIESEINDRTIRGHVLAPIVGLFRASHADGRPAFPRPALSALWRALKDDKPEWARQATDAAYYIDPDEPSPQVFDLMCSRAATQLKAAERADYAAINAMLEADRPGSSRTLILALEIAPIVRHPLTRMPEWLQRMTDDRRATARVAYNDAGAAGEGGGPLMFEMLAGHLKHPAQILRIVSSIMDKPGERYLADSELARFGVRAIAEVEARVSELREARPGLGEAQALKAAAIVQEIIEVLSELEQSVQMTRDGPWGARAAKVRQSMSATVEQRLQEIEEAVALCLPTHKVRYSARMSATVPKLDEPPNDSAISLAVGLLTFSEAVRSCANEGGFAGARGKVHDIVGQRIDKYVEDVLEQIRLGDLPDGERPREYLDVAARLLGLVRDRQAANVIRRRAAAA